MRALLYFGCLVAVGAGLAAAVASVTALRAEPGKASGEGAAPEKYRTAPPETERYDELLLLRDTASELRLLLEAEKVRREGSILQATIREHRILELEAELEELRLRHAEVLKRSRHYISRSRPAVRHGTG